MSTSSLYSISQDAIIANQLIELPPIGSGSTGVITNDFNVWQNGAPLMLNRSVDGNFNVWQNGAPILDINTISQSSQSSQSSATGMVIHMGLGGREIHVYGQFIETSSFHNKFTLKASGDLTARLIVESNTY